MSPRAVSHAGSRQAAVFVPGLVSATRKGLHMASCFLRNVYRKVRLYALACMLLLLTAATSLTRADGVVCVPAIQHMMDSVTDSSVHAHIGSLSGEWPVTVGGQAYTIATRHTSSGEPIEKATQYVFEYLEGLGLTASYFGYSGGRNVIGEKAGISSPDSVILMVAALDDMPSGDRAPGADANASGCAALMCAARQIVRHGLRHTIRFVFCTGSNQGYLGSSAYAQYLHAAGENVTAVLNMHMIGWNSTSSSPDVDLCIRADGYGGADSLLAVLFVDVVHAYRLDQHIQPHLRPVSLPFLDVKSFWAYGFPGFLCMEDYDDLSPHFGTVGDCLSTVDLVYCTSIARAALGTVAHLAGLMTPTDNETTGKTTRSTGRGGTMLFVPAWRNIAVKLCQPPLALSRMDIYTLRGRRTRTSASPACGGMPGARCTGLQAGAYLAREAW
ncbi:MAG: M28 family peptidase [Chitinivibrionales bacterium]|nr:M28 family peptidase [Chitinivibrionales bacterium]